jgi:hypothetical protein
MKHFVINIKACSLSALYGTLYMFIKDSIAEDPEYCKP